MAFSDDDLREIFSFLPYIYTVISLTWAVLLALWSTHLVRYRKYAFTLHRLLLIVPIVKLLVSILGSVNYFVCVFGATACQGPLSIVFRMSTVFYDITGFFCIFVISKGLSITRDYIDNQEKKTVIWNVSCLAICNIAVQLNQFFMFPLMVMWLVVFGNIFSGYMLNIRLLYSQFIYYKEFLKSRNNGVEDPSHTKLNPAFQKLIIFRRLQYLTSSLVLAKVLIYISVIVVSFETSPLLLKVSVTLRLFLQEFIDIAACALFALVLRLRDFRKFAPFNAITESEIENLDVEIIIDDPLEDLVEQLENIGNGASSPPPQQQTQQPLPLATLNEHKQSQPSSEEAPVVVIQNPFYEKVEKQYNSVFIALEPDDQFVEMD